jgi:hypothetical protein
MLEFLFGLVVGAVLGVVADRIWERIEARAKFRLTPGIFQGRGADGISYTVENVGSRDIPPFDLALWHPLRGTMVLFSGTLDEPLGADRTRKFECVLKGCDPDELGMLRAYLYHEKDVPVATVKASDFAFRIRLRDSDRILFESSEIGDRLAAAIAESLKTGVVSVGTMEDFQRLMADTSLWPKRMLRHRRERRETAAILAAHNEASGAS